MKYFIIQVGIFLLLLSCLSCSKEKELQETTTLKHQVPASTTEKIFVYQGKEYTILFDEDGEHLPTEQSNLLENEVAQETDLTAFSFSGKDQHKQYLFSSEMAGYKYIEDHIDKSTGRQLQVGHATNLLRDALIQQYGAPVDYKNPQIYAQAKAGIDQIYQEFKIASTPPTDVAAFMGELRTNQPNSKSTNNNSWRLWEDAIQNGEMFDIETAPNVWSWVHGEWDCNITYAAMSLDWNYRQNGQSWNDCISSYCINYQPGADAMCFGMYKDGFLQQGACKKYVKHVYSSDWYSGYFIPCQNDLTGLNYGSFLCSNLNDDISSLRMQVVWEGCPVSFHDF